MTSNRPTPRQLEFEFARESESTRHGPEPQRGQSALAAMKQTTLSAVPDSLMEQIVDPANMERAWKNVKANRGAPGPDGITLDEFFNTFRDKWPTVRQQLLDGTYQPAPARRKSIPKPDGSERKLGIPNVQERLLQQAILQVLTPIFDPGFSDSSFGFRPIVLLHKQRSKCKITFGPVIGHCVDMDLSKFFDRVQHDVLLARVARKVRDKRLLRLIGRYLRAGVMVGVDLQPSIEGTMQGGPLSPLLANILLDDFDKELERRGHHFVRYADDFLVFSKTREAARRVYVSVGRYLTRKLKLVVNRRKSRICGTDGVEFVGFIFVGYGGQIRVGPRTSRSSRTVSGRSRVASAACRWLDDTKSFAGISKGGWATFVWCQSRVLQRAGQMGSPAHP